LLLVLDRRGGILPPADGANTGRQNAAPTDQRDTIHSNDGREYAQ